MLQQISPLAPGLPCSMGRLSFKEMRHGLIFSSAVSHLDSVFASGGMGRDSFEFEPEEYDNGHHTLHVRVKDGSRWVDLLPIDDTIDLDFPTAAATLAEELEERLLDEGLIVKCEHTSYLYDAERATREGINRDGWGDYADWHRDQAGR